MPAATTPKQRIAAECARRGRHELIAGCVDLLRGRYHDVDDDLILALGGEPAAYVLTGGEGGKPGYWPRVWAARGLLYTWDPADGEAATAAIIHATSDTAWRVREMAGKVIAAHRLGDALDAIAALRDDPVPRVRAAAQRAVVALIGGEA